MKTDTVVELFYSGVWNDVTAYVKTQDDIEIDRGRPNEAGEIDPTELTLTLKNRDGRFSARNPSSPLYGLIGRNTPIRVGLGPGFVSEGFEDASLDIDVNDAGDAAWAIANDEAKEGSWSFKSGSIDHEESSDAVVSVPAGATRLSFWYKVSTEEGFDFFRVLVDAGQVIEASGELDWTFATLDVSGADTVTFRYIKDESVDDGGDAVWVDGLVFGDIRATCEVPKWPTWWDPSGAVVDTKITAAGIMRRLGQGSSPLRSAPYRAIVASAPAAYWALDDGKESTAAAPTVGEYPLAPNLGAPPEFGHTQPAAWLETLPRFSDASLKAGMSMLGFVDEWGIGSIVIPENNTNVPFIGASHLDEANEGYINHGLWVDTPTTLRSAWTFWPDDGGSSSGDDFDWAMPADFFDGQPHWWELRLSQNGSNIEHEVYVDGVALSLSAGTGVISSRTLEAAYRADIGGDGEDVLGHFGVWDDLASMDGIAAAALGFPGERAGRRLERLCAEEGVTFAAAGDLDDTIALGPQYAGAFLELLRHCEQADGGILFEPRDAIGLTYRTRVDLYNQTPALELDYTDEVFGSAPEPVEDDRTIRNDVTIKRPDGSTARAVQLAGPLSTQAPPDGVGTYATALERHTASDALLPALASWALALGTVDEPRYPALHLNLAAAAFTSDAVLSAAAAAVDVGDLVTIDGMPAWLPPGLVAVLAQGFAERVGNNEHHIEINASPASPYAVAEFEAAAGGTYRYDTAGSSLAAEFDAGADTSMSVDVDVLPLWTTAAGEVPFDIEVAGVRLTVTAVAGASSPQTFTITQAPVNGVEKLIPAGAAVALWTKARYAL